MSTPSWLTTLLQTLELKTIVRRGWERKNIPTPETVAAHSWGVSFLVLNTLPAHYDKERALTYAVLHDLGESIVGDITPFDGISHAEKREQETQAMNVLCSELPNGPELLAIWKEYERQDNAEAKFVRQLDRLDMALQAVYYGKAHEEDLLEFIESADSFISAPQLRPLIEEIKGAYHRLCRLNPPPENE